MMKYKYNIKLQELPRLTMFIKRFDTEIKSKASIFEEMQLKAFMLGNMEYSYWLVRQSISIVSFFRRTPPSGVSLRPVGKEIRNSDGFKIQHSHVKQRSDQRETVFVVPAAGGFADRLAIYLAKVNSELNKYTRRVW
jgi:hypothetical protein